MRKRNSNMFATLLLSTLLFINPIISVCQEFYVLNGGKEKFIQGDMQYPIYRSVSESDDDDFIKEPKQIVEFWIDHLLIRPAETIQYGTLAKLKADIGKTVSYSYSIDGNDKTKIGLELTPLSIENRRIHIDIKVFLGQKIIKEEKVFAKSINPIFVELFENKEKQEKFADEIFPLIRTIHPAIRYPHAIEKLKFLNYMLFINQKLVRRNVYNDLTVPGGSKDNPIFVGFFVEGKGMFVMSFSPFEGAEPIGVCRDNVMKFKHEGDLFEFVSLKPIMPEGRWLVWVRVNPFYDPVNDPARSEELRERLKLEYQKESTHVEFWFDSRSGEILERVFGKKAKNKKENL
jgi:hypothetical protein